MAKDVADVILKIIIVVAFVIVVYWGVELLFGGSPDLSQFNAMLIVLLGGLLMKLYREMGEVKVEIKYLSNGVKEGFERVRGDMGELKEDMGLIKKTLGA